jgi:hypothetical protein
MSWPNSISLIFIAPLAENPSPRNTIYGHAIGLICGNAAFELTGAVTLPFDEHPGIFWLRTIAATLLLSTSGAFMILLRASHPPARVTTLIVPLKINRTNVLSQWPQP